MGYLVLPIREQPRLLWVTWGHDISDLATRLQPSGAPRRRPANPTGVIDQQIQSVSRAPGLRTQWEIHFALDGMPVRRKFAK